jgi:hypothetical protein
MEADKPKDADSAVVNSPTRIAPHSMTEVKGEGKLKDSFNAYDVCCMCCPYNNYKTTIANGKITFDKLECFGICGDSLDVVTLRNVGKWVVSTDSNSLFPCFSKGSISAQLRGGEPMINKFTPAIFNGWSDAIKADSVIRVESRADRPPAPTFLTTPEMSVGKSWSRKTGCCGCSFSICTCCCCQIVEHTAHVGPADSITVIQDKMLESCCSRTLVVTGSTTDHVDYIAAEEPIGACAITGDRPNYGDCACACTDQAIFTVADDKDHPISVSVDKGEAAKITSAILDRALGDPSLGPEVALRSYPSRHLCFGSKGEFVITNKRAYFTGFKYYPMCCEMLLPGVPNLLCCLFQIHQKATIPLNKVTIVKVQSEGPCFAMCEASQAVKWAAGEAVRSIVMGQYVAFVVWLIVFAFNFVYTVISPIISLVCWQCRTVGIKIGGQGGSVDGWVHAPLDTNGLKMRELAIDIVELVRDTQESNKVKLQQAQLALTVGVAK